jgi:hypothetical protein
LELPLKNIVNRLEDWSLATHKVEEVDKLISEQEWKVKQSTFIFTYHSCRIKHGYRQTCYDYFLLLLLL